MNGLDYHQIKKKEKCNFFFSLEKFSSKKDNLNILIGNGNCKKKMTKYRYTLLHRFFSDIFENRPDKLDLDVCTQFLNH